MRSCKFFNVIKRSFQLRETFPLTCISFGNPTIHPHNAYVGRETNQVRFFNRALIMFSVIYAFSFFVLVNEKKEIFVVFLVNEIALTCPFTL